jgi:Tol biopolymer transport system component
MAAALATALVCAATAQSAGQDDKQFQAALQKEMVAGDLKGAIEQYRRIVDRPGVDRALAAEALLRMAGCYEKVGSAEARQVYERILRAYSDQTDAASRARAWLSTRTSTPVAASMTTRRLWTGPNVDGLGTVSPDGRTLSFVDWDTGDLAIHDFATGEDRRLTRKGTWEDSDDFAEESTISPDGTRVAYSWFVGAKRRYEIRVVRLDEPGLPTARTVYDNPEVRWIGPFDWSPDGQWLAVAVSRVDRTGEIGLIDVAEGTLKRLKSVDWRGANKMSFSPDGRFLAYDLPASDSSIQRDVYVMDLANLRESAVVNHPKFDVLVGWSPDGRSLLFGSDRVGPLALYSVPVSDGSATGDAGLVKLDFPPAWSSVSVTRTGSLIYYARTNTRNVYLATVDFETGKVLETPRPALESYFFGNSRPDWSADGRQLVFASEQPRNARGLSILSLPSGAVRELSLQMHYALRPRWTPDGSLAVEGSDLKGRGGLHRVDLETGEISPIVLRSGGVGPVGNVRQFSWSPDGRWLVFNRRTDGGSAIVMKDLRSGHERELRQRDRPITGVRLSPDGQRIAFVERDGTVDTLNVMSSEGSDIRELVRVESPHALGGLVEWTPDGQRIVFIRGAGTGPAGRSLWSIRSAGGNLVALDLDVASATPASLRIHPDGRQVAFDSPGPVTGEIWALESFLPANR